MIIALSGRKQSGKSELAKIAEDYGFTRMSFATSLKEVVCSLLGLSSIELNEKKSHDISFVFTNEVAKKISELTELPYDKVFSLCFGKECKTIREVLQFLGSNVIRIIDDNWHIDQVRKKLKFGKNYIFDDLRFPNEKKFLDENGALSFFVLRPRAFNYDNHESEIALRWHDFDDFICNNSKSLKGIKKKFSNFIKLITKSLVRNERFAEFTDRLHFREWLKKAFNEKGPIFIKNKFNWSMDSVNLWIYNLFIYRPTELYPVDRMAFSAPSVEAAYLAGVISADGCIKRNSINSNVTLSLAMMDSEPIERLKLFLKSDRSIYARNHQLSGRIIYEMNTNNPFVLENLKLWNIKPRKSEKEEVPWIVSNDLTSLKAWIVGFIDGDGSISFGKMKNEKYPNLKPSIRISILCSVEICNFLDKLIPIHKKIRNHKHTKLMEINFINHYVIDFFNWLGRPTIGMERKWKKVLEFEEIKTSRRTAKNEFSN